MKTLPPTREGFERPSTPDYMTTSELKAAKFSGTRRNSITMQMEIWTLGDIRTSIPEGDLVAFEKAFQDVFALSDVKIVTPTTGNDNLTNTHHNEERN